MSKKVQFEQLVEDIKDIERILAGKSEPDVPFLFSGGEFIVWYIRDRHYHPLLNQFPEGFILLHLSPKVPDIDALYDLCRYRLNEAATQQFSSELCDEIENMTSIEGLLFREFSNPVSKPQDNEWIELLTHRGTHPPNTYCDENKFTANNTISERPFFEFAILENHLDPIPKKDLRLISFLLDRELHKGKLSLAVPVVVAVEQFPEENWPLVPITNGGLEDEKDCQDDETTVDSTPAPVVRSSQAIHKLPSESVDSSASENEEARFIPSKSWRFYNLTKYSCYFCPDQHRKAIQTLIHRQLKANLNETPRVDKDKSAEVVMNVLSVCCPILHLNKGVHKDDLQWNGIEQNMSLGTFLNITTIGNSPSWQQLQSVKATTTTAAFCSVPKKHITGEQKMIELTGKALQMKGEVIGQWRYEIIKGGIFYQQQKLKERSEEELNQIFLEERVINVDNNLCVYIPGNLLY